jgi:hypothetical protein
MPAGKTELRARNGTPWKVAELKQLGKAPIPVLTSLLLYDPFVPFSIVPLAVVEARCEMARELLIADRTASPPGEGLKSYADTTAGKTTVYDKTDTRPVISPVAQAMLIKFGSLVNGKSGAVRLGKHLPITLLKKSTRPVFHKFPQNVQWHVPHDAACSVRLDKQN